MGRLSENYSSLTDIRWTLVLLAIYHMLWRSGDVLTTFIQHDVVAALLGILASTFIGPVVDWGLFAVAFYQVASRVSEAMLVDNRSPRIFRVIVTAVSLAYGVLMHATWFRVIAIPIGTDRASIGFVVVTLVALILVGLVFANQRLSAGHVIDFSTRAVFGSAVLGFISAVILGLYPFLELILFGWILLAVTRGYHNLPVPPFEVIGFETRSFREIARAIRTHKGFFSVVLIATGFLIAGFLVSSGVAVMTVRRAENVMGLTPLDWVVTLLVLSPFFVSGGFSAWFWYRELRRLPAFIDGWTSDDAAACSSITRPPLLLLPPALLIAAIAVSGQPVVSLGGVVIGFILVGWSGIKTLHIEPQSASSDRYALPGALIIQLGSLMAMGSTQFGRATLLSTGAALTALVVLFFLPDIEKYLRPQSSSVLVAVVAIVDIGFVAVMLRAGRIDYLLTPQSILAIFGLLAGTGFAVSRMEGL